MLLIGIVSLKHSRKAIQYKRSFDKHTSSRGDTAPGKCAETNEIHGKVSKKSNQPA